MTISLGEKKAKEEQAKKEQDEKETKALQEKVEADAAAGELTGETWHQGKGNLLAEVAGVWWGPTKIFGA